jgi:hypothetical protein
MKRVISVLASFLVVASAALGAEREPDAARFAPSLSAACRQNVGQADFGELSDANRGRKSPL